MLRAKFKVGQKVYAVSTKCDSKWIHVKCDLCNSTGKVKIKGKGDRYTCPKCNGKTTAEFYGYRYIISYPNAMIGKVNIEEYADKYKKCFRSKVTYMLDGTGVGSGAIWEENRLFATKDEAEDFCNKYIPSDYYDSESILKQEYNLMKC